MNKKLKIGWYSFSCCEDSTIIFTEMLNDHYLEWKNILDIRSALVLQRRDDHGEMDVAFVEGAITSEAQEKKLLDIRSRSKKIIAIGSCASVGMPSAQRNNFDEKTKEEISLVLTRFHYAPMVKKLSDVVKVDSMVPGCPMDENSFIRVLTQYLKEFGVIS
jgi:coenzyme F420-reducing hydrogenase gamma subunit